MLKLTHKQLEALLIHMDEQSYQNILQQLHIRPCKANYARLHQVMLSYGIDTTFGSSSVLKSGNQLPTT
jgi:hypothetical protein